MERSTVLARMRATMEFTRQLAVGFAGIKMHGSRGKAGTCS